MTETTTPGRVDYGTPATEPASYPGYTPPEAHELPSGAVFYLQRPQIFKMLKQGKLPNPLMEIVNDVFFNRDELELKAMAEERGITVEEMRGELAKEKADETLSGPPTQDQIDLGLEYMDVVVWAAIVKPDVELEQPIDGTPLTASGKLSYYALHEDDVQYILHWSNSPVASEGIATFPSQPGQPDSDGNGGAVRGTRKRPARAAA